jgi:hypothetical protein
MIISHSHRFIFIKSLKTAGTSVEAALSNCCSGTDVVTPLGNYEFNRDETGAWVHKSMNEGTYEQHDDARTIRQTLPPQTWSSYFKFSITRNPWDRALSYFFWDKRQDPTLKPQKSILRAIGLAQDEFTPVKGKFADFVRSGSLDNNDRFYVGDDGALCVDFVIRYEHLNDDFSTLCARLGLPDMQIPRLKTGIRKDKRPYTDYYDDDTRDIVAEVHRNDIRLFNYQFGQ